MLGFQDDFIDSIATDIPNTGATEYHVAPIPDIGFLDNYYITVTVGAIRDISSPFAILNETSPDYVNIIITCPAIAPDLTMTARSSLNAVWIYSSKDINATAIIDSNRIAATVFFEEFVFSNPSFGYMVFCMVLAVVTIMGLFYQHKLGTAHAKILFAQVRLTRRFCPGCATPYETSFMPRNCRECTSDLQQLSS